MQEVTFRIFPRMGLDFPPFEQFVGWGVHGPDPVSAETDAAPLLIGDDASIVVPLR